MNTLASAYPSYQILLTIGDLRPQKSTLSSARECHLTFLSDTDSCLCQTLLCGNGLLDLVIDYLGTHDLAVLSMEV